MISRIGTGSGMRLCNPGGKFNMKIPNMRTKGQCKLSEKELINKIQDLARKDAAAGKNSRYAESFHGVRQPSTEWRKLKDDFVSLASPNRMGIIRNTLSNLAGKVNSMQSSGDGRFDLFKILFNNNKKLGSDVGGNFVIFRDEQGNEIARYSEPNGWSYPYTPAEDARLDEFNDLWNQALADAQAELKQDAGREWVV